MRKPVQFISIAVAIIFCTWMMDTTLLEDGTGMDTHDLRRSAGAQDAYASGISMYVRSRNLLWNQSVIEFDNYSSSEMVQNSALADRDGGASTSKPNITTLLLLSYGIIGVVGFWRRVMR